MAKIMRVIFYILFFACSCFAQDEWVLISPSGLAVNFISDIEVLNADTILFTNNLQQLHITEDGGENWYSKAVDYIPTGNISVDSKQNIYISGLQAIVKSTDFGNTWTRIDSTIPELEYGLSIYQDTLYAVNYTGLYISSDYGSSWYHTNYTKPWPGIKRNQKYIFASNILPAHLNFERSSDNGQTWISITDGFQVTAYDAFNENELLLFSNWGNFGLFYSDDNGDSWTKTDYFQFPEYEIRGITKSIGERYFLKVTGAEGKGIYTSTSPTTGWKYIGFGDVNRTVMVLDNQRDILYVGVDGEGIYYYSGPYTPVELIRYSGKAVGLSVILEWQTASEANNKGFEIERKSGDSWSKIGFAEGNGTTADTHHYSFIDKTPKPGINEYRLKQIDFDGKFIYSEALTVIFGSYEYSLNQNYPNPFNPSTTISFTLQEECSVKIRIYDANGQLIETLTKENYSIGRHEINFDGKNLASGVYLYRIEASNKKNISVFFDMGKMVLIK